MRRASGDHHERAVLADGFDYDLQVWGKGGVCEGIGLNRALHGGLPWLEARVRAFGLEGHLKRLRARREP